MWSQLTDAAHIETCEQSGLQPLKSLVRSLMRREYASRVYGYWTHYMLHLSTAGSEEEALANPESGILCVVYLPDEQRFIVGFGETRESEWSATYRNGHWIRTGRWEESTEVDATLSLIDRIVSRHIGGV
jgi:hypothetical protein